MPLYLDVHNKIEGLTRRRRPTPTRRTSGSAQVRRQLPPVLVRRGHRQGVLPGRGPSKEAAAAVHREAHGVVADEIIEVKEGTDRRAPAAGCAARSAGTRTHPARTILQRLRDGLAGACPACGHANAPGQPVLQRVRRGARPVRGRPPRPFASQTLHAPAPRRADPRLPRRSRASASRSRCSSPTSRARWSCSADRDPEEARKLLDPSSSA